MISPNRVSNSLIKRIEITRAPSTLTYDDDVKTIWLDLHTMVKKGIQHRASLVKN